ncbi:uncharacterized protein LOC124372229, partial [Homalodisca vitripennis]|uniref:uncharacterized protein LOC124372229 n=1 Tax=Homalodisca vitripennis TaxID=197043 RepID=UPI001EECE33A
KMEPEVPSWLNESYFATVLQDGVDQEPRMTVTSFTAKSALPLDQNYGTYVFRVKVQYTLGESVDKHVISLIIKTPVSHGFLSEYMEKIDLFNREQRFYADVLSQLNKRAKFEFGPKDFYCPDRNRLVLKDLNEDGYVMADRSKQLDLSHCKLENTLEHQFAVKLVDFQYPRYSSPAVDLIYFIWTSADEGVRETKQEELLDIYLQTLNSTLEELGCQERLTAEELRQDLRALADWVLVLICQLLPTVLCEPKDVIKTEDFKQEDF